MLPEQVALVAAKALKATPLPHASEAKGNPGDIVVVCDPARTWGHRLVVVLADDDETMTVDILLAATDTEMASDFDLMVSPDESGLSFPLMVESELYGPVFVEQLLQTLGRLPESHRAAVGSALTTDGESLDGFWTGTSLGDTDDPRRQFKSQELRELDQLVGECRRWLMGEASDSQILDPGLLLPPPSGTARGEAIDRYLDLLDVLVAGGEELKELPRELVSIMGEAAMIEEIGRWWTDFRCDASSVLARFHFYEAGLDPADVDGVDTNDVLLGYLQVIATTGTRVVDVHSSRAAWRRETSILVVESDQGPCRARVLLLEAA